MSLPVADGRGVSVSGSEPDRRFQRSRRLTSRRQFLAVYGKGRRASCSSLTVFAISNDLDFCRLGLTVTRKVGGAVVRNRAKRRLRDIFRRNRDKLAASLDLVVNVHPSSVQQTTAEMERQFLSCVSRLIRNRNERDRGPDRSRRGAR